MADEEKQSLLPEREGSWKRHGNPRHSYEGVAQNGTPNDGDLDGRATGAVTGGDGAAAGRRQWAQVLYNNRAKVPGYGLVRMVRQARLYALYVLAAMLVVYLLNQLDRYTLPIVTTSVGADLRYGYKTCQVNPHVTSQMLNGSGLPDNFTDHCTTKHFQNHTVCEQDSLLPGMNVTACRWWWSGKGIVYQILAGPVFNNLYPLAGVFAGALADYWNRKIFLVVSLVFWSVATGLTGFARFFWHLVVLRALLAIGAAGCSPFAVSILGDYFPKELRGSALGIYYFGIYIGYSLAFAIGNSIDQLLGWRWVFYLSGIAGVAVAPIVLFTVREPKRTNTKDENTKKTKKKEKTGSTVKKNFWLLLVTFLMPGMFVLCVAGGIRNAGGYVWAYNTEIFFLKFYDERTIRHFMSWIPLVGGSLGAVVGGVISDLLVVNRGTAARIWVLVVSQVAAAPFAAGALFLPYPWCFLSLIPSNVIGEMWIGVTSAIVVDLAPQRIRTASVGLYLFIITVIGGNFNVLVDPIQQGFQQHFGDVTSLRLALLFTFPALYVVSSVFFLLAYFLMHLDLRRKQRVDRSYQMMNNNAEGEGDGEEEKERDSHSIEGGGDSEEKERDSHSIEGGGDSEEKEKERDSHSIDDNSTGKDDREGKDRDRDRDNVDKAT